MQNVDRYSVGIVHGSSGKTKEMISWRRDTVDRKKLILQWPQDCIIDYHRLIRSQSLKLLKDRFFFSLFRAVANIFWIYWNRLHLEIKIWVLSVKNKVNKLRNKLLLRATVLFMSIKTLISVKYSMLMIIYFIFVVSLLYCGFAECIWGFWIHICMYWLYYIPFNNR